MRTVPGARLWLAALVLCTALPARSWSQEGPSIEERIERAQSIIHGGSNLFEAYRLMRGVDPEEIRKAPPGLRGRYLWALGWSAYELGRYDEIDAISAQFLELFEESGQPSHEVYGLFCRALAREDESRILPKPAALAAMRKAAERADPGSPMHSLTLFEMGKLTTGEESRRYLDEALSAAETLGSSYSVFRIRSEIARQASRVDPAEGYNRLQAALSGFRHDPADPWPIYGWEARLEVVWRALPRDEAMAFSLDFLEEIEAWRHRQDESGTGSMGFFSVWTRAYRRVMGYILSAEATVPREDLELAFRLSERMRARVFLDRLLGQGTAGSSCADEETARRRDSIRAEIVTLQREIMRSGADVDRIRWKIESLLLDEEAIDRDSRCSGEPFDEDAFATIADVERTLGPDEALLVFHAGFWEDIRGAFDGGAWVFVLTRSGSDVHRLPDRSVLQLKKDALTGALRRRDGSEAGAAASLHADLLGEVVPRLPEGVRHLIIVPHGPVDGLPIAALRPSPDAPPIIDRYAFSYVPSATIWMSWRGLEPIVRRQALAFADPELESSSGGRLWSRARGAPLGQLPKAAEEGRALVESLGGKSACLQGPDASEHAFKQADLEDTGVLLFAAHAIVDERIPRLSSIVLTPGNPAEDGLLQPPEIAALDLRGSIVSLSACQSAGGQAIEGEGLLSLARSFFQAGATAVVGNLWPALDDEAADLFSRGYRNLARGSPVAHAFQEAQRESMLRGDPAEAWAGVMVLGLGSARLEDPPDGPWTLPIAAWLVPLGAVLLWSLLSLRRPARDRTST